VLKVGTGNGFASHSSIHSVPGFHISPTTHDGPSLQQF
jgi:hypothetical protein